MVAQRDEALAAVAGYTIVNDVSMRDWQRRTSQYLAGKTYDRVPEAAVRAIVSAQAGEIVDQAKRDE